MFALAERHVEVTAVPGLLLLGGRSSPVGLHLVRIEKSRPGQILAAVLLNAPEEDGVDGHTVLMQVADNEEAVVLVEQLRWVHAELVVVGLLGGMRRVVVLAEILDLVVMVRWIGGDAMIEFVWRRLFPRAPENSGGPPSVRTSFRSYNYFISLCLSPSISPSARRTCRCGPTAP